MTLGFPSVNVPVLSGVRGAHSRRLLLIATLVFIPLTRMHAQEHKEDHDHDHLHFSHPLVTESPSPDTKVRLDYLGARTSGPAGVHENTLRLELVGFAILSSTFHRRLGDPPERSLTFNTSALYRIQSRLEGLIEVTTARALIGPESGSQQTFIAPGFKVYPFTNRSLMFGASIELGTGLVRDTRALLLSAFYHF